MIFFVYLISKNLNLIYGLNGGLWNKPPNHMYIKISDYLFYTFEACNFCNSSTLFDKAPNDSARACILFCKSSTLFLSSS